MVRAARSTSFSTVPGLISQPAPEHLCLCVLTDHANIVQRFCCRIPTDMGPPATTISQSAAKQPSSPRAFVREICARCICAWKTRPFRPPGLSRQPKPATSITGKQTGDTHSKPAISIALALELGAGAVPTLTDLFSRTATWAANC